MSDLPKTFDPAAIEAKWYAHWESEGLFRPDRPGAEPWTIVNPPPNVTGSLHIGHALDNTLQDILTRHARLKGKDALWVVGTDHAGIATQMVVERQLAERQDKRTNYTREQFVEKVWDWKAESGGEITRQLRRLGCSMDWANERFTMDEGFSRAVLKVFVDLYNTIKPDSTRLLYRDKRLVNWDPGLKTAISDLEVEQREVNGHFWHFRYPLEDGSGYIAIATTRPETILGDGAVAVNPDDDRYRHLVGKRCRLPIVDRLIPIIADDYVKIDFGSGAVKITAAHDHNDYEVYKRHPEAGIPLINLMNADATMSDNCPPDYRGLDRYEARKKVVADFEALGLLDKVEDHVHMVPYGDRSGVVIEPWLTDQWYVDAATLAKPAIEAVRSGAIRIVPKTWEKTFFNWMENIQPWCVSRQLWWGHRIPAWFGPSIRNDAFDYDNLRHFVAETEEQALVLAEDFYGTPMQLVGDRIAQLNSVLEGPTQPVGYRDDDVLDTWFSSALWPFATLGWPDEIPPRDGEGDHSAQPNGGGGPVTRTAPTPTPPPPPAAPAVPLPVPGRNLRGRYPNDVLVSGFDILFFWDARMMMQGIHFMNDVPFKTLYLHGLVRAADGQKMSKSKGNTVDPLGLIDRYGADALRFFMAAMESQGRDIKMDEKRVEGYRNFATKLWNAARFCQSNGIGASATLEAPAATLAVNKWIIAETIETVQAVDLALADYRFDGAANAVYQFVWSRFCDWYLELIKPVLSNPPRDGEGDRSAQPNGGGGPVASAASTPTPPPPLASQAVPLPASGEDRGAEETRATAAWVFDQILVMLHPFMPFITEELWHAMGERPYDLIVAKWPMADARAIDPEAREEVDWLIETIQALRSQRIETNIPPSAILPTGLLVGSEGDLARINRNQNTLNRLARIRPANIVRVDHGEFVFRLDTMSSEYRMADQVDRTSFTSLQFPVGANTFISSVDGFVDMSAERARLSKSIETASKERDSLASRLDNPSFVERAKPEAVEKARADHAEKSAEAERLSAALARLG